MSTALVWFRHDLRLADNPALLAATRSAHAVVPVFIWSPEEEGAWAPGAAARWWLHESLARLDAALHERGSRLILRRGPAVQTLQALAAQCGATQCYWSCRHEPAALRVEQQLQHALQAEGMTGHGFHASRLAEPRSVTGTSGKPLQVFTPYLRAFLKQVRIEAPEASPQDLPAPARWPESLPLESLQLLPRVPWHRSLATHWQPGEAAARTALKQFVEQHLAQYGTLRDRPDLAISSRLSPYLRHGELSPRQVWTAVQRAATRQQLPDADPASSKFLTELVWREYATQQLVLHPGLPDTPRDARFDRLAWREEATEYQAWTRGRTGIAMVDAGMRELWQTGWMHNRVRMVTASFLVKNLLHDWRAGERWFWDTLVDADLASNALNWQWVAGCSPDAAPWFRIFNPDTQAQKFDPDGNYRRRFVPEAGTAAYPAPIVDLKSSRQRALDAIVAS